MAISLRTRRIIRNSFHYPLGETPPPTAILVNWFHAPRFRFGRKDSVRVFANAREAAQFAPEVLVATSEQLLTLNSAIVPTIKRALVALIRPEERLLSAAERDRLWRAFKVPVFEQIVGMSGELLAAECEAHDGLHLHSSEWTPSEDVYSIDRATCACGSKLPRLSAPELTERVRKMAAYAR